MLSNNYKAHDFQRPSTQRELSGEQNSVADCSRDSCWQKPVYPLRHSGQLMQTIMQTTDKLYYSIRENETKLRTEARPRVSLGSIKAWSLTPQDHKINCSRKQDRGKSPLLDLTTRQWGRGCHSTVTLKLSCEGAQNLQTVFTVQTVCRRPYTILTLEGPSEASKSNF